mmetsp:Transcript_8769/g.26007  ORF Transcript_8769/g.26007 Transcript_8769/m.26007 type:complete len:279 (+) Transcript_8769:525-1361(+)|eukprot:CAMPEP_0172358702 /NCGR_PEP_ID=MMETSP1060-20121228/2986_1 /TAXON_ID=37318 /ORGANISM="Pseudo-nitzschia pungens, Strain cf. cingulata" /LENGTH=278 /DNA_ID=CAMNT_0013080027 /DNA_START=532 /DNA_END=1368 /DNA_ORIENTATION=-
MNAAARTAAHAPSLRGAVAKRVTAAAIRHRRGHGHHQQQQQQQQQQCFQSILAGNHFSLTNPRNSDDEKRGERAIGAQHAYNNLSLGSSMSTSMSMPAMEELHFTSVSKRSYHSSMSVERGPAIVLGLATASALAFAGSSAVKSYNEWKDSQPTEEELNEMRKQEEEERAKLKAQSEREKKQEEQEQDASDKPRKNIFREWFDVGTKYYEGGFEDTMTKREAALILGVRESSSPARVKDAHRKLLILNHPDTGGSTYISGKVNEAKELLLKGKSTRNK